LIIYSYLIIYKTNIFYNIRLFVLCVIINKQLELMIIVKLNIICINHVVKWR